MVVDTSIILSVFFAEELSDWALEQLNIYRSELIMSTVNLAEALTHLQDRHAKNFSKLQEELLHSSIRFIPPTIEHAQLASLARLKYPLNFGDCFAYALAKQEKCAILTLDKDFKKLDCPVILPA